MKKVFNADLLDYCAFILDCQSASTETVCFSVGATIYAVMALDLM